MSGFFSAYTDMVRRNTEEYFVAKTNETNYVY